MKSAIVIAAFSAAAISLQGCGDSGTTTTTITTTKGPWTGTSTGQCDYEPDLMWSCPTTLSKTTFLDMTDGDSKNVTLKQGVLTLSGADWSTSLILNQTSCSGSVNFTVPNKTDHPDGNLTVALLSSQATTGGWPSCSTPSKYVLSFSNPGDTDYTPVNQWVESSGHTEMNTDAIPCLAELSPANFSYLDMADQDEKFVSLDCTDYSIWCYLRITPKTGNAWSVHANITRFNCSGMVDFNVPGKPNPPSFPLLTTFRVSRRVGDPVLVPDSPQKDFIEFSHNGVQLNQWVEVGNRTPSEQPTFTGSTTPPSVILA